MGLNEELRIQFNLDTAEKFVPDGLEPSAALVRTTHLAIGAYPDDIEFMAATPIPECFQAFVQEHIQYFAQDVSDRLNFLK